jgi:flavin reductase (DIM6/NTAB) family NADH-FMN oxidoreductase RutF/rubredoxin
MVDRKAFHTLSYGVYIAAAQTDELRAGCVVNTFQQVTSSPAQVSVAVNKDNATADVIKKAGRFTAAVLDETATMELIGRFGFKTSTEIDKFADTAFATDAAGQPYVTEHACAWASVLVDHAIDMGTHWVFLGEAEEAGVLSKEPPMTYAFYRQVKGGKTPPKASSYDATEAQAAPAPAPAAPAAGTSKWECQICGYVVEVEGDELPADFTCPVCGAGPDQFTRIA